jgi:hypothetical protein
MSIFVSIAAYRDPQLLPTIRDCLARARHPQALRFGICRQHAGDEPAAPDLRDDRRFRLHDVPWHASRGACWARAEIMRLWDGEEFFLQLDSHHRFVPDWDARLLDQMQRAAASRPLLSTYGAPFDPDAPTPATAQPMQMDFDRFTEDGIPLFRPRPIADHAAMARPRRARFVSAHFLFTLGRFVTDVPYDPELYFHGEEITLAIRAFTHGYTLLHPAEHILWHEYTRANRARHWDDHVPENGVGVAWHARDAASRARVRRFLAGGDVGGFGCGTARSLADYQAYAGLDFHNRAAQDATLHGIEPPNPPAAPDWPTAPRDWRVRIVLDRAALPPAALTEPRFWYVGLHDSDQAEIHRADASPEELRMLLRDAGPRIVIERQFRAASQPATWTVWPVCRAGRWQQKLDGVVDGGSLVRHDAQPGG